MHIAQDFFVFKKILPMIVTVLPIKVMKGEVDLLLDAKVLVAHVLHLYRDIMP